MKQYFSFQWHITEECDQRCRHCYIFLEDSRKKPDAMTWEQMQDVVDNCCDMCEMYSRLPYFYITGGDPILHPDFRRLLGLPKERDIPFTILGNPFHLNDEVCKKLKSCGCQKYQLSLDGVGDEHQGGSRHHRHSGRIWRGRICLCPVLPHRRGKGHRHNTAGIPGAAGLVPGMPCRCRRRTGKFL